MIVDTVTFIACRAAGLQVDGESVPYVAGWGEDPIELLPFAGHIQLRQATKGHVQRHPDEGGDVDFAAILERLDLLDYRGLLSVEYFDLPEYGWPLADPVGHCVALASYVRALSR